MPRDAKPTEIELKRDDFSTDKQEFAAEKLQEHWDSNTEFKELAEELYPNGPSDSLYRKVYSEYFGMPGDRRTFEQIRSEFGSVSDYLEKRNAGEVDLDFSTDDKQDQSMINEEEKQLEAWKQGYRAGYRDGRDDARADRVGSLSDVSGIDN